MPAPTGAHTELWYHWEIDSNDNVDFAAGTGTSDTDDKPFGGKATLSKLEGSNNAVEIFEPNDREMADLIAQHFDGSFTVDFEWSNPWWLQSVISEVTGTTDNADGSYTHTMDGDVPRPMMIAAGYEDRATSDAAGPAYRYLEGCVVQTATIDTSVEDTASVSLSGAYVNESWDDSVSSLNGQPSLNEDVMTFAEASLDLDSTTLSLVQDASVEINNNTDIIRELGTRIGVDYSPKGRVPSVDYTKIREDHSEVQDLYGASAATAVQQSVADGEAMTYQVDNGNSAGSGINKAQVSLNGQFPESVGTENFGDPQEDLKESINRRLRTVSITATNETSSPR